VNSFELKNERMNERDGLACVLYGVQRWTETYVRWSPQGTYLATFHHKGVALWGGDKFEQIMKFAHPGLQLIDFSPCERLVTQLF
jgi:uncharacterized protein with WD repeat